MELQTTSWIGPSFVQEVLFFKTKNGPVCESKIKFGKNLRKIPHVACMLPRTLENDHELTQAWMWRAHIIYFFNIPHSISTLFWLQYHPNVIFWFIWQENKQKRNLL